MAFVWAQYIKIAEELIAQGDSSLIESAYFRSSVSRAYYGAYCTARDIVEQTLGFSVPKGDSHTFVINKFKYSSGRVTRKVGEDLNRLHEKRRKVDYEASADIDSTYAKTALEQAQGIFKLFSDPNVKIDAK